MKQGISAQAFYHPSTKVIRFSFRGSPGRERITPVKPLTALEPGTEREHEAKSNKAVKTNALSRLAIHIRSFPRLFDACRFAHPNRHGWPTRTQGRFSQTRVGRSALDAPRRAATRSLATHPHRTGARNTLIAEIVVKTALSRQK